MEKIIEITKQRVNDNKGMFTQEEMKIIQKNIKMASKLYSLGNLDTVNSFLNQKSKEVLVNANL